MERLLIMINLNSIKSENKRLVFSTVAKNKRISRAEISAKTGLSVVTIGKIADAFVEFGLMTETKRLDQAAGRRAGILSLNAEKLIIVMERGQTGTAAVIYAITMDPLAVIRFDEDCSLEDVFTAVAEKFVSEFDPANCVGLGMLCDVADEWNKMTEYAKTFFPDTQYIIGSSVYASTLSMGTHLGQDELGMYLCFNRKYVRGAFVMNGKIIPRQHERFAELGSIYTSGICLLDYLNSATDTEKYGQAVGGSIYNASRITYTDTFALEIEDRENASGIVKIAEEYVNKRYGEINEKPPRVIDANDGIKYSHSGAIKRLCRLWIERISAN